jgi:hypothetical protein
MGEYTVKPLGPDTWDDFAQLAERHNGVWGGCWCTWFHTAHAEKSFSRPTTGSPASSSTRSTGGPAWRGWRAEAGGGVVEAYPQDTGDKKVSASFLYNGTRTLFEQAGFTFDRPKGKNHCAMTTAIKPS